MTEEEFNSLKNKIKEQEEQVQKYNSIIANINHYNYFEQMLKEHCLIDSKEKYDITLVTGCKNKTEDTDYWTNIIVKAPYGEVSRLTIHNDDITQVLIDALMPYIDKERDKFKEQLEKL